MYELVVLMNLCDGIKHEISEGRLINAETEAESLLKQIRGIITEKEDKENKQNG